MVVVRLKKAWRGLGDWAESPSSDVLDRTAYARYGSLLDNSIAGKGIFICPSIAGSGCSINRSLVAMNRYSGLFLEWPIQLGTKFISAHS